MRTRWRSQVGKRCTVGGFKGFKLLIKCLRSGGVKEPNFLGPKMVLIVDSCHLIALVLRPLSTPSCKNFSTCLTLGFPTEIPSDSHQKKNFFQVQHKSCWWRGVWKPGGWTGPSPNSLFLPVPAVQKLGCQTIDARVGVNEGILSQEVWSVREPEWRAHCHVDYHWIP